MELLRSLAPREACSYLPDQEQQLEYRFIVGATPARYQRLIERGWRRFGYTFFRPACRSCHRCRSLRVDVADFAPSKSQRRNLRRNEDVRVEIRRPMVSQRHLDLYNAYHRDMAERRDWPFRVMRRDDYIESYVAGYGRFGYEFAYIRAGKLIGVGLVDILPRGLSSVYFYHDPEWRSEGPGTFSVLKEIETARDRGRPYLYLGYWVAENSSMDYKARFTPHEILRGYVEDDQPAEWVRPETFGDPSLLTETRVGYPV